MTASTFGVAINTTSAVTAEVCEVITKKMGPKYIHLPRSQESMQRKGSEFEAKFGMTQEFGCVDGTHIPIKCPAEDSQDFSAISSIIPSAHKQYVIIGVISWMWSACGLEVFMTLKFSQIPL